MNLAPTSAKIYQFPVRARTTSDIGRLETKYSADLRAAGGPQVLASSGWYHETAVQDAQRTGKH